MEISNFRKINKDRLSKFLEHLENKNIDTDEIFGKCLVSLFKKNTSIDYLAFNQNKIKSVI